MSHARITQLRISGMRVIDEVKLDLEGLTVLIGDNGSGKSTLLEALELLRKAAKPANYVSDVVVQAHGGLHSLLRRGARELKLGVTVKSGTGKMEYDFALANVGTAPQVVSETLNVYERYDKLSQDFRKRNKLQECATRSQSFRLFIESLAADDVAPV